MKKVLFVLAISAGFLTACNNGGSGESTTAKETETKAASPSDNPDYAPGLAVEVNQNCNTCHKIDEKLTGPSYADIANKYAGTSDTIVSHLADKIIAGGSGVWGEVPMLPHPDLAKEDAEKIVKYIFTFKGK